MPSRRTVGRWIRVLVDSTDKVLKDELKAMWLDAAGGAMTADMWSAANGD